MSASNPSVDIAAAAFASSTKEAPKVEIVVLAGSDNVLISASTSLSIKAPAAVTLAVSVTSEPFSTFKKVLTCVAEPETTLSLFNLDFTLASVYQRFTGEPSSAMSSVTKVRVPPRDTEEPLIVIRIT